MITPKQKIGHTQKGTTFEPLDSGLISTLVACLAHFAATDKVPWRLSQESVHSGTPEVLPARGGRSTTGPARMSVRSSRSVCIGAAFHGR